MTPSVASRLRARRRAGAALTLVALLLLAAPPLARADDPCALPRVSGDEDEGLGGTGLGPGSDEEEGIGGTGLGGDEEDGVGGTGIGVLGSVTALGSICVNGLRIDYEADTPTEVDGEHAQAEVLAPGHVVAVHATRGAEGDALRAERIRLRHVVRGPVTALRAPDGGASAISVLGERVHLGAALEDAAFAAGEEVAVSGLRRADGSIEATRIERSEGPGHAPSRARARVVGRLRVGDDGRASVGATGVALAGPPEAALVDEEVVATGVWNADAARLESARVEPAAPFAAAETAEVSIGGYVESVERDAEAEPRLRLGAFRVDARAAAGREIAVDDYVVVRGRLGARGIVRAERVALDVRPPRVRILRPMRPPRAEAPVRPTAADRPAPAARPPQTRPPPVPDVARPPLDRPERPSLPPRPERPPRPATDLRPQRLHVPR